MADVVSFKQKKKERTESAMEKNSPSNRTRETQHMTFEEISRRNAENAERLKKERSQANKNVLRSYRIK